MTQFINSIQPGQWTIIVMLVVAALLKAASVWINKRPDQTRANTEGRIADGNAAEIQFKAFRVEVHGYKNQVTKLLAGQMVSDRKILELERLLTNALSTSSMRREQMNSMMSLIDLLIAELARLDPKSIIVPQAKALLKQMRDSSARPSDPMKSEGMNNADHTVMDAEQTVMTAKAQRESIRHSEEDSDE